MEESPRIFVFLEHSWQHRKWQHSPEQLTWWALVLIRKKTQNKNKLTQYNLHNPRLQKLRDPELIWKDVIYTLDLRSNLWTHFRCKRFWLSSYSENIGSKKGVNDIFSSCLNVLFFTVATQFCCEAPEMFHEVQNFSPTFHQHGAEQITTELSLLSELVL